MYADKQHNCEMESQYTDCILGYLSSTTVMPAPPKRTSSS